MALAVFKSDLGESKSNWHKLNGQTKERREEDGLKASPLCCSLLSPEKQNISHLWPAFEALVAVIKVALKPDWVLRDHSLQILPSLISCGGEMRFLLFRAMRREQDELSLCRIDGSSAYSSALDTGMG